MATLRFTGERTGRGPLFAYDEARHLIAYHHAVTLAEGRAVLDAGCGDGTGSALLASVATRVLGVDRDPAAVAACRRTWGDVGNLEFRVADVAAAALRDECFDLITCFQVIEHIHDDRGFVRGLRRLLAPEGMLVLTTPNILRTVSENPYHVREYTAEQLRALLEPEFDEVEIVGVRGNTRIDEFERRRAESVQRILRLDPFGLRRVLPRRMIEAVFPRLATLVRRQAAQTDEPITVADFHVDTRALDRALDLVAHCRG